MIHVLAFLRRLATVVVGLLLALPLVLGTASAHAEEMAKVLTVEKAGGPEAVVGDAVKAVLETGTKSQFIKTDGEITCGKSEILGKIETNPVKGGGAKAEIKIETFSFAECTTNITGLTVKSVAVSAFPVIAKTVGTTAFEMTENNGINFGILFTIESGGIERKCEYRVGALNAAYRNNSEGEIEIDQLLGSFTNRGNCAAEPPEPTWKAKYRPLKDETGGRAGKQIYIN